VTEQGPSGSVNLTPARALAVAALFGAIGGWVVVITANALDLSPPRVPWTTPIAVILVAALVGALAYSTYQRLHVRRERMEPQRAVAFLVLGKASALAGAVVAGGYLAYALMFVTRMDAATPRERVIRSLVAMVTGIVLSIAGLLLERACRVPRDSDSERESAADDDLDADTGN
jgi:uncharacterized membrane protein YdcZ (DUF606 family)